MRCLLCGDPNPHFLTRDKSRDYHHCTKCDFVFVPQEQYVSLEEEKKRYLLHDNSPGNKGYVRYLEEVVSIVSDELDGSNAKVLDFGAGEQAVLTGLLRHKSIRCTPYDPLFAIGSETLNEQYDGIVLCEVIEHLRGIRDQLEMIRKLTTQSASLVIRTQPYPSLDTFTDWWYTKDPTHINYFSKKSLGFVAGYLDRNLVMSRYEDIFILKS